MPRRRYRRSRHGKAPPRRRDVGAIPIPVVASDASLVLKKGAVPGAASPSPCLAEGSGQLNQATIRMQPRTPQTDAEWASYRDLRWRVLRAPWNQPPHIDAGEDLEDCIHAMIADDAGKAIAVGRIIFKSTGEAQIRSMATAEDRRGQGLGRRIMEYLEQAARQRGATAIFLNARDNAVPFYAKLGYEPVGEGPLLFGCIPHTVMKKSL
jgi:predicted GNAT family N-acyltransferase